VEPGRTTREETVPPDPGSGLESPVPHPSTPLTPAQPQTLHEPQLTALTTPRSAFEWRQYGGGPEHDHSRALEDDIHAPRVLWFVPGCLGQPTLAGDDLYSGGLGLARLDPDTGNPKGIFLDLSELSEAELDLTGSLDHILAQLALVDPSTLETITTRLGEVAAGERGFDVFGPAPVITSDLVLVRRTNDVLAFDRGLSRVWSWDSGLDASPQDSPTRAPLCLTDTGIVLVSFSRELVALDASDGHEVWRFPINGTIEMAPAASGERVFFGMDRGLFVALSAGTGRVLWQKAARGFGTGGPMVVGERVFVADDPYKPWAITSGSTLLHAWDVSSGASLWEAPLFRGGRLRTGLSFRKATGQLVAPTVTSVEQYDIANGKHDFRQPSLKSAPSGTAVVVGKSLVFADDEGRLCVHELESESREVSGTSESGAIGYTQDTERGENGLRWAFQPPEQAKVEDFVHTGDRIYVATTIGLFCLADDPTRAPPAAGFVLSCEDGSYLPPFFAREK
jgi:outer membrane protein assembly factor BamB